MTRRGSGSWPSRCAARASPCRWVIRCLWSGRAVVQKISWGSIFRQTSATACGTNRTASRLGACSHAHTHARKDRSHDFRPRFFRARACCDFQVTVSAMLCRSVRCEDSGVELNSVQLLVNTIDFKLSAASHRQRLRGVCNPAEGGSFCGKAQLGPLQTRRGGQRPGVSRRGFIKLSGESPSFTQTRAEQKTAFGNLPRSSTKKAPTGCGPHHLTG
jgi:hypothetical protein